jgi:hypothetical protein
MTKFLRILGELQELVESEGKTLNEFDPDWTQPDVYIADEFSTGYPFTRSNILVPHFQQEETTEPVERIKPTLNECMKFLKETLIDSGANNLEIEYNSGLASPCITTNLTARPICNPSWEEGAYEAAFKKPAPETIVVEGVTYRKVD